ncbi:MAG: T9SS type A sorting domain-containing protein [Bacteroidota bacterium]|nr:T9SS type A sorting domain-containing protein [Bacteroidota bacterium]
MKKLLYLIITILITGQMKAQQTYCDFEGIKTMHFGLPTGTLDSLTANSFPNAINTSANCAMYIRDTCLYDLLKIYPNSKMADVTIYANNSFSTPKIKMKVYSTAPAGTVVNLQLGKRSDDNYPAGVHSEYIASTTLENAWQTLSFNYYQSPSGSLTAPIDVDKIIVLFNPGFSTTDTLYIDDIMAPAQISTGILKNENTSLKLFQNSPNPAKEKTQVSFQVGTAGPVSLKLYDMLGNPMVSLLEEDLKAGTHSVVVDTQNIPNGIYFYVLNKDGVSRSLKLIVSK